MAALKEKKHHHQESVMENKTLMEVVEDTKKQLVDTQQQQTALSTRHSVQMQENKDNWRLVVEKLKAEMENKEKSKKTVSQVRGNRK